MTETTFDSERAYRDDRFTAIEVFRDDQMKVVCGFFEPGQFIPVQAPCSNVAIHVRSGTGLVRDGDEEQTVESGDVVVVESDSDRGIKADADSRLEALLVVSPPLTDAEYEPLHNELYRDVFAPQNL